MRFHAKIDDYDVSAMCYGGSIEFRCEQFDGRFDTYERLEAAVRAYDLKLRKEFTNTEAWTLDRWSAGKEALAVTVTSIVDEKEAWIKNSKGRREKVNRGSLFATKDELLAATEQDKALEEQRKALWAAVPRWQPATE